jgi:hypothetical protein
MRINRSLHLGIAMLLVVALLAIVVPSATVAGDYWETSTWNPWPDYPNYKVEGKAQTEIWASPDYWPTEITVKAWHQYGPSSSGPWTTVGSSEDFRSKTWWGHFWVYCLPECQGVWQYYWRTMSEHRAYKQSQQIGYQLQYSNAVYMTFWY